MNIDIERLKADPAYWDEVAKPWATHFDPFLENWINYKDGWLGIIHVSDDSNVWRTREGVLPSGAIPRPAPKQWSGPQDELPPVGVVCLMDNARLGWAEVEIVAEKSGYLFGWCDKEAQVYFSNEPSDFAPLKTEKERLVEAAMDASCHTLKTGATPKQMFESLYDAGLIKMPEDDQ